jgi:hypothetical protein
MNKWTEQFSNAEVQVDNKYKQKCPTSSAIKEIQIQLHCDSTSPQIGYQKENK